MLINYNVSDCANCSASNDASEMVFDEQAEQYYCDRQCFDEWAADNNDKVGAFYYKLNCYE